MPAFSLDQSQRLGTGRIDSITMEPSEVEAKSPRHLEDILPAETWMKVLENCLYTRGDFNSRLQWEDVAGTGIEIEEEQEVFKESFFLVSRSSYMMARQLLSKYLVLTSQDDIHETHHRLRDDKMGVWTERIYLRVSKAYIPGSLRWILQFTPNLRVLTIRNEKPDWSTEVRYRPDTLIRALGKFCPNLVRLQFESFGEEPSVRLVKDLLHLMPRLQTLHLDSVYWPAQGDDDNGNPIDTRHTALETLSIGSLRRQCANADGIERAGVFLKACLARDSLPGLNTVHFQKPIPFMQEFLEKYGPQVRELGFAVGDLSFAEGTDWIRPDKWHPHITSHCPNLSRMVLITQDRPLAASVRPLHSLGTVKEIGVVHIPPRQPNTWSRGAVLLALEEIHLACFPALESIAVAIATYREAVEGVEGWYEAVEETERRGVAVETIEL